MGGRVSVIIDVGNNFEALRSLMVSLDAQSLSYGEFHVFIAIADTAERDQLERLASRRPNVTVQSAGPLVLDEIVSDYVLSLSLDSLGATLGLLPEALERLRDYADATDAEAVAGRSVGVPAVDAPRDLLLSNVSRVAPERLAEIRQVPCMLVRRSALLPARDASLGIHESSRSMALEHIAVLADYPSLVGDPNMMGPGGAELQVLAATFTWRGSAATIDIRASVPCGTETFESPQLWLSARHLSSGLDLHLPAEISVDREEDHYLVDLRGAADVLAGPLGRPFEQGVWQLIVGACSGATSWTALIPLRSAQGGIINGTLVSAGMKQGGLCLDIGATTWSVVGRIALGDATVSENARGALLTLHLPHLNVLGESSTRGAVFLDRFRLLAQLVAERDAARVECYVSGLAGTKSVSTKFGKSGSAATGLSVVISALGVMSLRESSPKLPDSAVKPAVRAARAKKKASPPRRGLVAQIRRHVPQPIEPLARALAGNRFARRAYQALTRPLN